MRAQGKKYLNKISVGTASFGMNYGISNQKIIPKDEVLKIVKISAKFGINFFDTAPLYGLSEKLLGEITNKNDKITTKTKQINKIKINKDDVNSIENCFETSLKLLKRDNVYSLLVHNSNNLINTGGDRLYSWMEKIKKKGKIKKIGISVYTEKELDLALNKYSIDLVQLPLNIFDQRFLQSGYIDYLSKRKIEIHARSIFLQGLILANTKVIPINLKKYSKKIKAVQDFAYKNKLSIVELLMSFAMKNNKIDKFIIGVNSEFHIKNIITSIKKIKNLKNLSDFSETNEKLIIPKNWQ